jgi:hypothetical protein
MSGLALGYPCPLLRAVIGACFCDGFCTKAVSSFKRRAIYRGIEGCVMRERNSRKEILHVFVLRVVAFGEASIEMLHNAYPGPYCSVLLLQ